MNNQSLFHRLGGYEGISLFANDLLSRLQSDSVLGRFWEHRGADGVAREKQLLIDFLCSVTGGPLFYTGRDMKTTHVGMNINENDWTLFLGHAAAAMASLSVPQRECDEVVEFVLSIKGDVVD